MLIRVITTADDFARTLDAPMHRVNRWLLPEQDVLEGEVDAAVSEITERRAEIGPHAQADGLEASLVAVEAPLRRLRSLGFQLVAVFTTGTCVVTTGAGQPRFAIPAVEMVDYLVAPDPCYFRLVRPDLSGDVHRLGAPCTPGHGEIVLGAEDEREKQFSIWSAMEILTRDFERSVPWCDTCRV
jgi:hypothetical protein